MDILKPTNEPMVLPAKRAAKQLQRQASQTFMQLVNTYEEGLRIFWSNPQVTPQEISDEMGNQAVQFFMVHGALAQFIKTLEPNQALTDVTTLGTFTFNQDGTVTAAKLVDE